MSSRPRILILGSTGQIGRELQRSLAGAGEVVSRDRKTVDFTAQEQVRNVVRSVAPDVIVNAAAYTAVDRAETEPDIAMAVNGKAPEVLAEEAARLGALLVHYSTDYVFDGSKAGAWVETDATNPLNTYGVSKLAGEEAIRRIGGKSLILRTSWVYGPHGSNFMLTMLRLGRERDQLKVVDDQIGAPTTSIELARATRTLVDGVLEGRFGPVSTWAGTYHLTCGGSVSWCGFARAIFARAKTALGGKQPVVRPIPTSEYPTPAKRPLNSLLSNHKINTLLGVRLAAWEDALDRALGAWEAPRILADE
jgi:dTDP-4-dehydrorhamnose reductase